MLRAIRCKMSLPVVPAGTAVTVNLPRTLFWWRRKTYGHMLRAIRSETCESPGEEKGLAPEVYRTRIDARGSLTEAPAFGTTSASRSPPPKICSWLLLSEIGIYARGSSYWAAFHRQDSDRRKIFAWR
ncbi:hypothetical protein HPB50_013817 [Hyalomma asiaticum]|uniref:Uncharacterized protein n=1 Tax=Hyalomma asiaticum TaxID=266040 RepID=A0ACB7T1M5_HYAAI|nr:hypothetical protein HPB50_013817 [Hyalomma asiaticum]